jgi:hypothetical protein
MDDDEKRVLSEKVRNALKSSVHPCYENTSHTEVYCRCPYCGDSTKSKTSAHFYIKMQPPFLYNCFKCGRSGRLTAKTLEDLGVYDNDVSIGVTTAGSDINQDELTHGTVHQQQRKKIVVEEIKSSATDAGLAYFNSRFNTDLSLEYVNSKFKCICDLQTFFKKEGIYPPSGFDYSNAIGFVSSDDSHVICRDITGKQQRRYTNVNIVGDGNDDSISKIYTISAGIDILCPKVSLVITEGIFDIIGIYLAKYKDTPEESNAIFSAGCGKSYSSVIEKFIGKGFLNMDVIIYSDSDVGIDYFQEMLKADPYASKLGITVFYNSKSKDCGVPRDQIALVKAAI